MVSVAAVSRPSRKTEAPVGVDVITKRPVRSMPFFRSGLNPRAQKIAPRATVKTKAATVIEKIVRCLAKKFI